MRARPLAVLVMAALSLSVTAGAGRAAPGRTWRVAVGAESADHAVLILDNYPRTLTIDAGDIVVWASGSTEAHTVTFLSGELRPTVPVPLFDGRVEVNPDVVRPEGGPAYDGTGIASSGLLTSGRTWSVRFTRPGRYAYVCLLHPSHTGAVVVQPPGTAYPATQDVYDRRAAQERAAAVAAGEHLRAATRVAVSRSGRATVHTIPLLADPRRRLSIARFGVPALTVKAGDSVRWVQRDPDLIHTVTFAPAVPPPPVMLSAPQPQGPPRLFFNPRVMFPAGGGRHTGGGYYNSGFLWRTSPPGSMAYELTFTTPGTFTYVCAVHGPRGMRGTVTVVR